ncbi:hypothetical protein ILYODFUR_034917, partial [Ilyodon furcidens]
VSRFINAEKEFQHKSERQYQIVQYSESSSVFYLHWIKGGTCDRDGLPDEISASLAGELRILWEFSPLVGGAGTESPRLLFFPNPGC